MKFIFSIFIILFSFTSKAQYTDATHYLIVGTDYIKFNHKDGIVAPKIQFGIMLHDNISINYSIAGGSGYFHSPLTAPIAGIAALGGIATQDSSYRAVYFAAAIIAVLIPEGVSGHIPLTKEIYITPTINPLCLEYVSDKRPLNNYDLFGAFQVGLTVDAFFAKNFFVKAGASLKRGYLNDRKAHAFELGLAYYFN